MPSLSRTGYLRGVVAIALLLALPLPCRGDVSLALTDGGIVVPGGATVIAVSLDNPVAYDGLEFVVTYDPSFLSIDSIQLAGRLQGSKLSGGNVFQSGTIAFIAFDSLTPSLEPGTGSIFSVHVSAAAGAPLGWYPFDIQDGAIVDATPLYGNLSAFNGGVFVVNCACPFQSDLNEDGFTDAVDLAIQIDVVFFGTPDFQDPGCPSTRADFNADGLADAVDLAFLIDHIFFGQPGPCNPCGPIEPTCAP